jgi:hypothetical protein
MQVGVPPVATTIFFGANDAALLGRTSERQHVPVEEYRQNLRTIVNHLKVNLFPFMFLIASSCYVGPMLIVLQVVFFYARIMIQTCYS